MKQSTAFYDNIRLTNTLQKNWELHIQLGLSDVNFGNIIILKSPLSDVYLFFTFQI